MNAKYLCVTLHDNDFTLKVIGNAIQSIFNSEGKYPTEEDLPQLKELIARLWYAMYNMSMMMRWKGTHNPHEEVPFKVFNVDVKIVDYLEIPDWENQENFYIPLFDGEVLLI